MPYIAVRYLPTSYFYIKSYIRRCQSQSVLLLLGCKAGLIDFQINASTGRRKRKHWIHAEAHAQYAVHCTLHMQHDMLYYLRWRPCTLHFSFSTPHCTPLTLHTLSLTLRTPHSTLCTSHFPLRTLYSQYYFLQHKVRIWFEAVIVSQFTLTTAGRYVWHEPGMSVQRAWNRTLY